MAEKQQPENTGKAQGQTPERQADQADQPEQGGGERRPMGQGAETRQVSARPDGTGDVRGVPDEVDDATSDTGKRPQQ